MTTHEERERELAKQDHLALPKNPFDIPLYLNYAEVRWRDCIHTYVGPSSHIHTWLRRLLELNGEVDHLTIVMKWRPNGTWSFGEKYTPGTKFFLAVIT